MTERIDPKRSAQMALIGGKNTKPEIVVRKIVDNLRYKYALHRSDLPGKPDLVLDHQRKAIFVHGCFWHQHRNHFCWRSRVPRTRRHFWIPKLAGNAARDKKVIRNLRRDGWQILVIWECQTIVSKRANLKTRLRRFLSR